MSEDKKPTSRVRGTLAKGNTDSGVPKRESRVRGTLKK